MEEDLGGEGEALHRVSEGKCVNSNNQRQRITAKGTQNKTKMARESKLKTRWDYVVGCGRSRDCVRWNTNSFSFSFFFFCCKKCTYATAVSNRVRTCKTHNITKLKFWSLLEKNWKNSNFTLVETDVTNKKKSVLPVNNESLNDETLFWTHHFWEC